MSKKDLIDEQIIKEYVIAKEDIMFWNDTFRYDKFKTEHPIEYKIFSAMDRKHSAVLDTFRAMMYSNEPIYWITLTFNNEKDNNSVVWKRKEAEYFLSNIAPVYLIIEEYGEDNNRYHIHGFIIFKYGKGFNGFRKWHSRQKIIEIKTFKKGMKRVSYLTNYVTKDVPRLRRSRQCSKLYNFYKSIKRLRHSFKSVFEADMRNYCLNNIDLF